MAQGVTINITADTSQATHAASQLSANLSTAFSGVQTQLNQMAAASGQASSKMTTGLQSLSQQVIKQVAVQGNLSKSFLQTGQAAQTQLNQFEKLRQQYLKQEQASAGLSRQLSGLVASIKNLAAVAGIGLSIQSIVAFGQSIVEAGIAHDRLMLSLKGALGTAQAAGEAYAFVEGVANRLGIGLVTAVEGFAKLSAATQGTVVQGQQTRDLFVAISEASRVMGLTTAETGGIVAALTQIIGKNTVSMEELRQQLGDRLPSALRLTAKEMGLTTSALIDMVTKGQILAVDFIPGVTRALQQMGKEAPEAAKSVQAALERLGNAWLTLKVTIAQSGLLEVVSGVMAEMTRIVNQTTNWINRTKRMAGEMGLTPLVGEMQRVTQEIQMWQEVLGEENLFAPREDEARRNIKTLEEQKNKLAEQIAVKNKLLETNKALTDAEEARAAQDVKNASAKEAEIAQLTKWGSAWISVNDDIKEVESTLKALRSFDVESLKALKIDISATDAEQQFNQAEAFLLKRLKELNDKRAGINKGDAARAVQEAGQSAVEIAKAREEALATSLKREEAMIQQSADERRRIADEEAIAALQTQGPSAVAEIDAKRSQARRQIAVDEAQFLETLRLKALDDQEKLRAATLQADIAAAGKNKSAATKAQEELNALASDTEAERVKIRAKTEDALQNVSKKSADEQIKQARELNKIIQETEQERLQARINLVDEQIALIQAQVDGEVLTTQEGIAQIQALEAQRFADVRLQYEQKAMDAINAINDEVHKTVEGSQDRVQAEAIAAEQIAKIREGLGHDIQTVELQQQTQQQQHLNELSRGWRQWVRDVQGALGNFLFDWASGQVDSIKDVLNSLKSYFFRLIADMVAYAATRAIIIPIVSAVVGGVGGGGSGGLLSTISQAIGLASSATGLGGTGGAGTGSTSILQLLGLGKMGLELNSFLGPQGVLSGAFDFLTNTVLSGAQSIANFVNAFKFGTDIATESAINLSAAMDAAIPGTPVAGSGLGAGAVTAGTVLGAAGGLAALGGGIYAAINASNAASRAAFAASAAAGAAATATAAIGAGLLGASAATAVGTGWTGVGLIVAAVMAVIGVVLDKVIKPEGPSLSVRAGGGLGIGVQDGKLAVEGGVGSRATRREGVDRELANTVAQQLDEGITNAVKSIVQTINAVALDPAALLGPTQAALQQTLRNLQPINSANAKKMEKDIQEQLRFANLAIVGGLLEPVNLAFDQLRDQGDLKEQLDRLPGTTAGLVAVFKTMNQQLDEIGSVQNTDVLRQLSGVRNQVENFGNRISGTAGQIAESIVNQLVDQLVAAGSAGIEQVRLDPGARFNKTGSAVDDLDRSLAEQITDFSEMMQTSVRAITILRNTKDILEQSGLGGGAVGRQIDRLAIVTGDAAGRISKQIVTTALTSLADDLDQLLLRPLQLQAVGVNSLFNDGLATLAALQVQWNQLSALGIDTKGLQEQFSRLLGGLLESAMTVLNQAFAGGTFAEFLSVLVSIPDDLARLNPQLAQLKQLGLIFAQVVAPMDQAIMTLEDSLLTTAERVTFTETRMADLRSAIADAGNAVDQALPLYAALSEAIQANAAAQIASVNEVADAQIKAAQESADTQIQAVHDAADAHLQWINTVADAQIAAINASSDALTEGVSAYFDAAAEQLRQFVEELTTAINTWADVANTTAGQLRTVNETILAEQSPAAQQRALREQEARLLAMATGGGAGSQAALSELISVEQQLLALAKRSNNLKAQQDSLDKLTAIQNALREQLVALTGQSDPIIAQIVIAEVQKEYLKQIADFNTAYSRYLETTQGAYLKAIADQTAAMVAGVEAGRTSQIDAVNASATAQILSIETARDAQVTAINESRDAMITAIKVDVINQLKALEGALQHLFEGQDVVNGTLHVPFTVRVAPAGAYAQGGMVGAMLEPGERVFNPPFAGAQEGALVAMNRAFPRFAGGGFTVPGRGTGDTVPMILPRGSFVMNRRAAGAMGYQGGGMVSGSLGGHPIVVNIDLRGATVRNQGDYTRLTTEFREAVREALREIERRSPKRGS